MLGCGRPREFGPRLGDERTTGHTVRKHAIRLPLDTYGPGSSLAGGGWSSGLERKACSAI